ncbi:MAG TPA: DUF58 domain-containing protein [Gammaproteobacteria bacterium]|nr:DUF58 domain-containing protein [Gammaproteobacteria bacterium]
MFSRLARYARERAIRWAEARQGKDPDPVRLERRRVYILPTRIGLAYGLMVFAMLLGAMNYNNSMGFFLAFLLAGLGLVAMHHCHRQIEGLVLRLGRIEPVFAGQVAVFNVIVENRSRAARYGITLTYEERHVARTDVEAESDAVLPLTIQTSKRGLFKPGRFGVHTTFPFGLFRAWAWVRMDMACVVYPKPAEGHLEPPPHAAERGETRRTESGQDDFSGLRAYRMGDSPRHIAWKVYAREQGLQIKQFTGTDALSHWFDWDDLAGLDPEARLSQLCRWVLDAHAAGASWGLRLPDRTIPLGHGHGHRDRSLEALALFEPVGVPRRAAA